MNAFFPPAMLVAVLCSTAVPSWGQNHAPDRLYVVDLTAGTMHSVLLELANELQVSLFFAKETVSGLHADSIEGEYTLESLFTNLLDGSCLEFAFVRATLVAISPGCPTAATEAPAAPIVNRPEPASAPDVIEEIIVQERYLTGSRLRNHAFGQSMPLDVIDQTEIRLSGYQAVGELLRYVPAVSGNSTSTLVSNGGDGTATVTLRGLPASNTLVLLNGRRMNTDALQGGAVDLNTLPLAMVEQIEILKDGVSAIYGSDAIAGVVNIITKQSISGMALDIYGGQSAEGDLQTQNLSLSFGGGGDNWSASAGFNYYDQKGVKSIDRSLSAISDDRHRGGIDKRSSATSPARIGLPGGSVILDDGATGTLPADFRAVEDNDRFEYRRHTTSIVPSERSSAFTYVTYDFDAYWQGYFEGLATDTKANTAMAPVPLFTAFESIPLTIDANQAFNPFGVDVEDVRRRVVELPTRRQVNETTTLRGIVGIRRRGNGFNLDFAIQANETDAEEKLNHGLNVNLVANALRAGCVAPCVPLNLFGPAGSISSEMLAYVGTSARITGTSKMTAVTLDTDWVVRETNIGNIEISAGFEYRHDQLKTSPDHVLQNQALVAGGNRSAVRGARDIWEAYAEVYVPLARNERFAERVDMQIATRFSRYSDFGYQVNPRLVLSWMPVQGLTLRTSVARGFRSPTLLQLHGSAQQSFEQLNDPCSVAANVPTYLGCDQQSDPSLNQFLTVIGGDENLEPERSITFSAGMLLQQQWQNLDAAFSVDWFNIEQEDVVDSSAQYVLNQNAGLGRFDERVSRNSDGNIDGVLATLQNIGRREVSGFDLATSIVKDFKKWGRFTLAINATHIAQFRDKFDPESPTVDKAGTFSDEASGGLGALPDWKWNTGISWQHTHWQGHYNIYRVSDLKEIVPLLYETRTIDPWTTHNTNMSYLGPYSSWIRITLGVNNLFNEAPPFSAAAFNDSYDARTYDITGRFYFLKFDKTI